MLNSRSVRTSCLSNFRQNSPELNEKKMCIEENFL